MSDTTDLKERDELYAKMAMQDNAFDRIWYLEQLMLQELDKLAELAEDKRCVALARTNIQQGFMWAGMSMVDTQQSAKPSAHELSEFLENLADDYSKQGKAKAAAEQNEQKGLPL